MKPKKQFAKLAILFGIGGLLYVGIELLWRGRSHPSMFVLGGACFVLLGLINVVLPWEMGLLWQSLIGAGIVTVLELVTGLVVNIWLGWGVWDYSNVPFNLLGQICLPFTAAWAILAAAGIVLDDWLRYWLFGEQRPHYKLL